MPGSESGTEFRRRHFVSVLYPQPPEGGDGRDDKAKSWVGPEDAADLRKLVGGGRYVAGRDLVPETPVGNGEEIDEQPNHRPSEDLHGVHVKAGPGGAAEIHKHAPIAGDQQHDDDRSHPGEKAGKDAGPKLQTLASRVDIADGGKERPGPMDANFVRPQCPKPGLYQPRKIKRE